MARTACIPPPDSSQGFSFRHRPPDPIWAPSALLDRCRKALAAYSPDLSLWWDQLRRFPSELPGRWTVVRWSQRSGAWERIFYWEGQNGEYRDPSPGPLVDRIGVCDLEARGVNLRELAKSMRNGNDRTAAAKKGAANALAWEDSLDRANREQHSADPKKKISIAAKPGA